MPGLLSLHGLRFLQDALACTSYQPHSFSSLAHACQSVHHQKAMRAGGCAALPAVQQQLPQGAPSGCAWLPIECRIYGLQCALCRWRCGLPAVQQAALNAACGLCIMRVRAAQVAVRPYLLYSSSSHEGTPSGRARLPTASPPPTTILGSVDMMLTAIGTAIQVPLTFPLASPWPGPHGHSEHCYHCEDTPAAMMPDSLDSLR